MKVKIIISGLVLILVLFASCESYLDKTPDATVTDKDIFGTFKSFQGFMDPCYADVVDYNNYQKASGDFGGDVYSYSGWSAAMYGNNGNYTTMFKVAQHDIFNASYPNYPGGIWPGGWRTIRLCNLALKNLPLLVNATDEEKTLIKGQIYFFRAMCHQAIIECFGGMPYIDTVFAASDELRMPRITYQACTERIVEDFDKAIALLPGNWDNTVVGASRGVGANVGRATKGAALAYKAKALLYAASPLMNKFSGSSDYTYNVDYAKRAAAAGWDFITWNNSTNTYALLTFTNYNDQFSKRDGTMPWTSETIWQRVINRVGRDTWFQYQRHITAGITRFGGGGNCETVNQLYIDKFEMADGSRYQLSYDSDNSKRWVGRDPRFYKSIIIDREQHGTSPLTKVNFYEGTGSDKVVAQQVALPYAIKKFWLKGANEYDKQYDGYRTVYPKMRLAEVYLDYAEAVTAAYGPGGSAPGSTLTAVGALNIVRQRAGMPDVTEAATGYANFMDLVRNERNVELCFEGHYWWDIRRWYIGHLPENKLIVDLHFDKNWTPSSFSRTTFFTRVFEDPKHYWMPIPRNMTLLYPGMYQNPGWQ